MKGGTDPVSQNRNNQKSNPNEGNKGIPNIDVFCNSNPNSLLHSQLPVPISPIPFFQLANRHIPVLNSPLSPNGPFKKLLNSRN